jgi:hypothetical protein
MKRIASSLVVLAALLAGCGGIEDKRRPGVPGHRADRVPGRHRVHGAGHRQPVCSAAQRVPVHGHAGARGRRYRQRRPHRGDLGGQERRHGARQEQYRDHVTPRVRRPGDDQRPLQPRHQPRVVASAFAGEASSNQSNSLSGSIAVQVSRVLPNGNLVVQGEKWIELNQGDEYIRLRGIIRPEDVSPTNTIPSTLVADARISYGGTGALNEANTRAG